MCTPDEQSILRAENAQLQAANAALQTVLEQTQAQLTAALARIAELEQEHRDPPTFVNPNRPKAPQPKPRKKRAAEHNHGRKRMVPTRTVAHQLERCPDCDYQLQGKSLEYTREVIELPDPQPVEVIEHRVIKRFCPHCQRWHSPTLELTGQVLGQGRIGVRIAALISYLRTTMRLPIRRIQIYLASIHQLHLSIGELVELLHRVRRTLQPEIDALKAQARASPILHGDETVWRQNGQNGYIWAFSTPGDDAIRYYEYDHSRGQVVVKRILDGRFAGHLVSDFYAGYNIYAGQHQRCWVHLLRDLHDLKKAHAEDADVQTWAAKVRARYDDAHDGQTTLASPTAQERETQYVDLTSRSHALGLQYATTYDHPCCALAKRLLRHEDELFQFVLVPGLAADNNLAERSIRPLVVIRKISGGSRSDEGSKTRMGLATLFETWQARHQNPSVRCLELLRQTAPAAS